MDVFHALIDSYEHKPIKKSQRVVVCTHATYSTYLFCVALKAKGFQVAFLPVSYSNNKEHIEAIKAAGIDVITEDDLLTLIPRTDLAVEDGARISKFIAQHGIRIKKYFFSVEQTSGGIRYLAANIPEYPVIDVALSPLKLDVENRRATPEAIIQQYSEQTGQTLGGKRLLIIGFGSIGEGLARLARVLGARVTIYDSSNVRAVFARHRGYNIVSKSSLDAALGVQDVIFMATSRYDGNMLDAKRMLLLKEGTVVVNGGSGRGELDQIFWEPSEHQLHDAKLTVEEDNGHLIISSEKTGQKKKVKILGAGYPVNLHLGKGTSHDAIQFVMAMILLALIDGPNSSKKGIQPLSTKIQEHIAGAYIQIEEPKTFEPTYVSTGDIDLSERPYGGVFPFHNDLNDKAHFAVVRAWFKSGSKTRGHYHLRSQEAYYVISGEAKIITWKFDVPKAVKQTHYMRSGDYLLVPEGYFHDVIVESKEDFQTLVISSPPFQIWDQFFEEKNNE